MSCISIVKRYKQNFAKIFSMELDPETKSSLQTIEQFLNQKESLYQDFWLVQQVFCNPRQRALISINDLLNSIENSLYMLFIPNCHKCFVHPLEQLDYMIRHTITIFICGIPV